MNGMNGSGAGLVARMHSLMADLSPAEGRVASLLAADPLGGAQLTIEALATAASTSTATVVRTAKRLGFPGYPQLRLALAAQPTAGGSAEPPLAADVEQGDSPATVLAKLAAFEREAITATAELVDPEVIAAVVAAMAGARRIDVYGIGASGLVALDLAQKLQRIGLYCIAHTEHDAGLVSASLLGAGDVAIGISHSGRTPGTVLPLQRAKESGATTVAITGAVGSPLALGSDLALLTSGKELGFRSAAMASRTGQLLLVDSLFVSIAGQTSSARSALQRTYDVISAGNNRRPLEKEDH
ncbi:MurR/RpiR family transcriptional regulator [Arthrobacter sp. 35W]|uniref:MurR/RpiR family transcriptional regulator n=1 Tax=Arthrobacter sp. 35W TaxID=1132441 RepID=UPI00040621C6|nr:MurR/RpiR family transcriptional regulator [Arthrobacter sp. 35W]